MVGPLGKVLGPRGLMPSPRAGTVTPDVGKVIKEYKAGKVEFRNDAGGNVHAVVGKLSFDAPKLAENIAAFINHVIEHEAGRRPRTVHQGDRRQRHDEPQRADPDAESTVTAAAAVTIAEQLSEVVMSKYVKNLIADHLRDRLQNVHDALLVNMVGLDANTNTRLRAELRRKEHPRGGGQEQPGGPGHGRHAAGAAVRRAWRHGGRLLGRRRHRQPGQGNHQAGRERQVQAASRPAAA